MTYLLLWYRFAFQNETLRFFLSFTIKEVISAVTENTQVMSSVLFLGVWRTESRINDHIHCRSFCWLFSRLISLLFSLQNVRKRWKVLISVFSKMSCQPQFHFSLLIFFFFFFYLNQIVSDSFHHQHNLFIFCSSHGVFYLFSASLRLHVCKFLIISEEVTWREEFNLLIKLIAGKRDTKAFFSLFNWLTCVVVDSSI